MAYGRVEIQKVYPTIVLRNPENLTDYFVFRIKKQVQELFIANSKLPQLAILDALQRDMKKIIDITKHKIEPDLLMRVIREIVHGDKAEYDINDMNTLKYLLGHGYLKEHLLNAFITAVKGFCFHALYILIAHDRKHPALTPQDLVTIVSAHAERQAELKIAKANSHAREITFAMREDPSNMVRILYQLEEYTKEVAKRSLSTDGINYAPWQQSAAAPAQTASVTASAATPLTAQGPQFFAYASAPAASQAVSTSTAAAPGLSHSTEPADKSG